MHVAIITKSFPSVSQTFIALQILELIRAGYTVTVISLTYPKSGEAVNITFTPEQFRKESNNLPVYSTLYNARDSYGAFLKKFVRVISFNFKKSPSAFISCLPYLLKGKVGYKKIKDLLYDSEVLNNLVDADLIHCQFADLADRVVTANKAGLFRTSAPIVFSVRGYDVTRKPVVKNINWKQLSDRCSLALPVCYHFKELLVQLGWERSKIHVVPSPINIEKTKDIQKVAKTCDKINIISVGRLTEKKGLMMQ